MQALNFNRLPWSELNKPLLTIRCWRWSWTNQEIYIPSHSGPEASLIANFNTSPRKLHLGAHCTAIARINTLPPRNLGIVSSWAEWGKLNLLFPVICSNKDQIEISCCRWWRRFYWDNCEGALRQLFIWGRWRMMSYCNKRNHPRRLSFHFAM